MHLSRERERFRDDGELLAEIGNRDGLNMLADDRIVVSRSSAMADRAFPVSGWRVMPSRSPAVASLLSHSRAV